MDLTDRIYGLDRILRGARTPVSRSALQEKLECSRATVGRIIDQMRTFLNAWDHDCRALRSFSVDRILTARVLEQAALDIPDSRLNAHFATAYGIFAGQPRHKAILRFKAESARWVADETWHPDQKGWFDYGHYFLEIPYADPRELVHDILKHGPDVTVVSPATLRAEVARCLQEALRSYK